MRALDLFCGAGGVSVGLQRAGFRVVGVDINPQPHYPEDFAFCRKDALTVLDQLIEGTGLGWDTRFKHSFDLIWASPPCQHYSMYSRNLGTSSAHPDLIQPVRQRLRKLGVPYIIENVVGAPLLNPTMLCGTAFGLKVLRHRLFETSFPIGQLTPPCAHRGDEIPVYGNGTPQWHREKLGRNVTVKEQRQAMGIDWMPRTSLTEAIPPAYAEWLARRFLEHRGAA